MGLPKSLFSDSPRSSRLHRELGRADSGRPYATVVELAALASTIVHNIPTLMILGSCVFSTLSSKWSGASIISLILLNGDYFPGQHSRSRPARP